MVISEYYISRSLFTVTFPFTTFFNRMSIFSFIASGQYNQVTTLIESDPNTTTCTDEVDNTLLHYLAYRNQQVLVKLLIHMGSDVTAVNQNGETAFHLACQSGSVYVVHLLLNATTGSNQCLTEKDKMGRTPVHHAAYSGNPEMLHYLYLNWNVDLTDTDIRHWNVLHICAALAHHRSAMYLMRNEKISLFSQTPEGDTALHLVLQKLTLLTAWHMVVAGGDRLTTLPNNNGDTLMDVLRRDQRSVVRKFTPLIEAVVNKRTFATHPWHIWLAYLLGPGVTYDICILFICYITYPYGYLLGIFLFTFSWFYFLSPHRIPHPVGWECPSSMGLLVLGSINVGFAYLIIIAPFFYPNLFNTIISVCVCLISMWLYFTAKGRATSVKLGSGNRETERQRYRERFPLDEEPSAYTKSLQFCHICEVLQFPRSKHCKLCDRCVLEFDHHCTWLSSCVGSGNHRRFFILIHFMSFTVLQFMASVIVYCIGQCETWNILELLKCASYSHRVLVVLFTCSGICMVFLLNSVYLQWVHVSNNGTYYFRSAKARLGYLARFKNILLFLTDYQGWVQRREISQLRKV